MRASTKGSVHRFEQKRPVAVIGAGRATPEMLVAAFDLGVGLAKRGYPIICGGKGGVMERVCAGPTQEEGLSIGILPSTSSRPNASCSVHLLRDLGNADDPLVASASRASVSGRVSRNRVIVVGALCVFAVWGGPGTANELEFARECRHRVFGICNPPEPEGWSGPSIWDAAGSLFTKHTVAQALRAIDQFQ